MPQISPPRIKFWPNKENRTVEMEVDTLGGTVTISVEMDLEHAVDVRNDFADAIQIVQEDWITN